MKKKKGLFDGKAEVREVEGIFFGIVRTPEVLEFAPDPVDDCYVPAFQTSTEEEEEEEETSETSNEEPKERKSSYSSRRTSPKRSEEEEEEEEEDSDEEFHTKHHKKQQQHHHHHSHNSKRKRKNRRHSDDELDGEVDGEESRKEKRRKSTTETTREITEKEKTMLGSTMSTSYRKANIPISSPPTTTTPNNSGWGNWQIQQQQQQPQQQSPKPNKFEFPSWLPFGMQQPQPQNQSPPHQQIAPALPQHSFQSPPIPQKQRQFSYQQNPNYQSRGFGTLAQINKANTMIQLSEQIKANQQNQRKAPAPILNIDQVQQQNQIQQQQRVFQQIPEPTPAELWWKTDKMTPKAKIENWKRDSLSHSQHHDHNHNHQQQSQTNPVFSPNSTTPDDEHKKLKKLKNDLAELVKKELYSSLKTVLNGDKEEFKRMAKAATEKIEKWMVGSKLFDVNHKRVYDAVKRQIQHELDKFAKKKSTSTSKTITAPKTTTQTQTSQ